MRHAFAKLFCVVAVILGGACGIARAEDWTEPKDGLFTEKQVENYAAAQKEIMQLLKAMGKAVEGNKSGLGAMTLAAGIDNKVSVILAKHDLKKPEYEWLTGKVFECIGVSMIDLSMDQARLDMAEQKKKTATETAAAKAKVANYELAAKKGTRVLTKEQRDEATKSAKEAMTAALDEAKQHADEAKTASDEAAKAESDARAADALAKNPPADVEADSRPDYIKGKKDEAENFRNSAKESRDKEKEARKFEAESKAKGATAAAAMAQPEVPVTNEEKAQVKKENEEGLASAKSELETLIQAGQLQADTDGQFKTQTAEMHKNIQEPNLALVKKHLKELQEAWGMAEKK